MKRIQQAGGAFLLLAAVAGGWACAAEAASAAAALPANGNTLTSVMDLLGAAGWTMYIIIGLSVVAMALTFYFVFTLRTEVLFPEALLRKLEVAAAEGKVKEMRETCLASDAPAAKMLLNALEHFEMENKASYELLSGAVEDEGARQAGAMWSRVQYLLDIGVVAPMVGLLGTVFGMVRSFSGMKTELGNVIPTELAHGVSQALVCTAGGLVLAIPAMLLYAVFRSRVLALVSELEGSCGRVLRRLCYALNNPTK
jgi:biopolymer transport protein ExbB